MFMFRVFCEPSVLTDENFHVIPIHIDEVLYNDLAQLAMP